MVRPKQWKIGGEFGETLEFDGVTILNLHEGTQLNATNLPKLVENLNRAGVVFPLPKPVNPQKVKEAMADPQAIPLETLARSCLGKKKMGEVAAKSCALKFGQRAYHCVLCHGWHCTHLLPDIKVHG